MSITTAPIRSSSDAVRTLDRALVTRLQLHRHYPSVSVLLTTTPGSSLATDDVVRMHHLLRLAERRVRDAASPEQAHAVMRHLQQLAVAARRSPAGRAVALFASPAHAEAVQLPVTVEDRVVVDATFASRDLVRALRAVDRFRLLVLDLHGFRILEGHGGRLDEIPVDPFPDARPGGREDRSGMFGRDRSDVRDAVLHARIRAADLALASRRVAEPLPLVIAGVERHLAMFRARSAEAPTVVGAIVGSHRRTPASRLARLAGPVIEEFHRRRTAMALARLDVGIDRGRVVSGIDAVWAAALTGRVQLLCVEENLTVPTPAPADVAASAAIDDIIDELVELVTLADGDVAFIDDGSLSAHSGVAALVAR
jgi:hypothetical protein